MGRGTGGLGTGSNGRSWEERAAQIRGAFWPVQTLQGEVLSTKTSARYSRPNFPWPPCPLLLTLPAASFQLLDRSVVQTCYRDDIRRLLNASDTTAVDDIDFFGVLTGDRLSTLSISNNQARVRASDCPRAAQIP